MRIQRASLSKMIVVFLLVAPALSIFWGQGRGRDMAPWEELASELAHQGYKTDTQSLISLAKSNRPEGTRWMAIEILGLRGEQAARPMLHDVLKNDSSRLLRDTAAVALGRLKDPEGIPSLRELVKTAATEERQIYLASQLAMLKDSSGYSYIVTATKSKDPHLRYLAAGALANFIQFEVNGAAKIDAAEQLILLANDSDPKVRNEVIIHFILAVYNGASITKFRPIVEQMAHNDPDQQVKENADRTLTLWKEQCRQQSKGCK